MYWGYQQRSIAWTAFLDAMGKLSAGSAPPRVCMEAHSHIDYGIPWLTRLEQLIEMRARLARQAALRTRVVMLLRLRSPLRLYVSYYLWTVAERQARAPEKFGSTFEEWARRVPNLQTELLLSSKSAFAASFAPGGHPDLVAWQRRWSTPERHAARRKLALHSVHAFDVLGTTERFAESTLLVGSLLNWSVTDSVPAADKADMAPQPADTCMKRSAFKATRMWWCRNPLRSADSERRRVHARVCPNMTACRELISRIAPVDEELYAIAAAHLDHAVAAKGERFQDDLAQYRRITTKNSKEAAINRINNLQLQRCMWRRMTPIVIGGPQLEKNNRKIVWQVAPNFSASDGACVPGDNAVMRLMWAEHRQGGRVSTGWPAQNLVPYRPRSRRGVGVGGGAGGGGGGRGLGRYSPLLPWSRKTNRGNATERTVERPGQVRKQKRLMRRSVVDGIPVTQYTDPATHEELNRLGTSS